MPLKHQKFFSTNSALYASARPHYPEPLFKFLASLCPDLNRAWDCGTGSGQAAITMAKYFQEIEASDVSPEQISNALMQKRVNYSVQHAEATNFANDSFSLVTVAQALHWFDLQKFWPEVQRVLKPQGVFAAWAYSWFRISEEIDSVIKEKLLDKIEAYWAPQNHLAWNGYQTISFPFTEIKSPPIAFTQEWNLDQLLSYLGTWSATGNYIEAQGDDWFKTLAETLKIVWGNHQATRTITMDFYLRIGRHEIR